MLASRAWAVQILEVALSLLKENFLLCNFLLLSISFRSCTIYWWYFLINYLMCCSLVWRASLKHSCPSVSLVTPTIRPGMCLTNWFLVAKNPEHFLIYCFHHYCLFFSNENYGKVLKFYSIKLIQDIDSIWWFTCMGATIAHWDSKPLASSKGNICSKFTRRL